MIKLSIIIPVYNVEAFLAKCIDSVLYPSLPGYEIIIINDGSPDGSPAIAQSYVDRYPELITLISTPNGGLGHARNEGIAAAKGEYLLFLDSDDYLCENAVPEMMEALNGGQDIIIFDALTVNEAGEVLNSSRGCEAEGALSLESCPSLLNSMPNAWNKLCRRTLFTESGIRFPDRAWYEDLYTMPKLYLLTDSLYSVRRSWYRYLMRSGSITNSKNEKRNLEIIPAVDTIIDYYKSNGKYEQYETELEYMAFYNQYLTACTRVAQINSRSSILDELRDNFIKKFPDFEKNEKIKTMPKKWALLTKLIKARQYGAVAAIMKLNNKIRGK